jgi:hypothetical protein
MGPAFIKVCSHGHAEYSRARWISGSGSACGMLENPQRRRPRPAAANGRPGLEPQRVERATVPCPVYPSTGRIPSPLRALFTQPREQTSRRPHPLPAAPSLPAAATLSALASSPAEMSRARRESATEARQLPFVGVVNRRAQLLHDPDGARHRLRRINLRLPPQGFRRRLGFRNALRNDHFKRSA